MICICRMAGTGLASGVNLGILTCKTDLTPFNIISIKLFVVKAVTWLVPSNELLLNFNDCPESFNIKETPLAVTNIFVNEENGVEPSLFISNLIFKLFFSLLLNFGLLFHQGVRSSCNHIAINDNWITHDEAIVLTFHVDIEHLLAKCNGCEDYQD